MPKDKKIAGVKVSKKLRKIGKQARKLAGQPVVSEIVAAALLSAAAALRGTETGRKAARKSGDEMSAAVGEAARESGKVGDSLRKLAIDLARRTLDNWDEAGAAMSASASGKSAKPKAGKAKGGKAKKA
jgi:hypothetical protein